MIGAMRKMFLNMNSIYRDVIKKMVCIGLELNVISKLVLIIIYIFTF